MLEREIEGMEHESDTASIIAKYEQEFLVDCLENLDGADEAINGMVAGGEGFPAHLDNFLRLVHSIKGKAGTFGFPAISAVAHRAEDFIEALKNTSAHMNEVQVFIDRMREIAESGFNPDADDCARLLATLPRANMRIATVRPSREVNVLLVMPRDVQRKIIGQELSSCGFGISFVATGVDAISAVLAESPDIIVSSVILKDMTGMDLARALDGIEAVHGGHFILLSSSPVSNEQFAKLPNHVAIVYKGTGYAESLTEHLIGWGMFGKTA